MNKIFNLNKNRGIKKINKRGLWNMTTEIDDLIKKLNNDDVDERMEAASTLGSTNDGKVIERVINAIDHVLDDVL